MKAIFSRLNKTHFIAICAAATCATGSAVLIGWTADIPFLRTLLSSPIEMKPNVAVSFLFIGTAIFFLSIWKDRGLSKRLAAFCGLVVAAIGNFTLIEWFAGSNLGIDQLFFAVARSDWTGVYPGRMPPHSALALGLIGTCIVLTAFKVSSRISDLLMSIVRVIAIIALLGMLYGVDRLYGLYGMTHHNSMPLVTAVFLLVVTVAISLIDENSRLSRIVFSTGAGGSMGRWTIPVVMLVPPLVGLVLQFCTQMGIFDREFRLTMTITLSIVVMSLILFRHSMSVDEMDAHRNLIEKELADKEERFRDLFNYSQGMICVHDINGILKTVNPAVLSSTGYGRDEIEGRNIREFLPEEHRIGIEAFLRQIENEGLAKGLLPIVAKNGRSLMWSYHSILVTDVGKEPYVIGHALDVTELMEAQSELRSLSLTDGLTGLYNRRGFLNLAEQQLRLERHAGTARGLTLLFADMDGLKNINDTFGHKAGSEAIQSLSKTLKNAVRDSDIVARWGGDEFVVLAIGTQDENVNSIVDRINTEIDIFNTTSGRPFKLACSIGIAPVEFDVDKTFEEVISEADEAMYAEKRRRKADRSDLSTSQSDSASLVDFAWY